jgi:hypothetical protein
VRKIIPNVRKETQKLCLQLQPLRVRYWQSRTDLLEHLIDQLIGVGFLVANECTDGLLEQDRRFSNRSITSINFKKVVDSIEDGRM